MYPRRGSQRGFVSSRQALVLLALLFLTPVFVAWFMHMSADHGWRPSGTTNKGVLIQPPRPLVLPNGLVRVTGEPLNQAFLRGKWTLIYIGSAACDAGCRQSLDAMARAHIALGENMRRVQRLFLVTGETAEAGMPTLLADFPELVAARLSTGQAAEIAPAFGVEDGPLRNSGSIYLADPMGNLMMYYRLDTDPRGIIQDLQRLLKYSFIG